MPTLSPTVLPPIDPALADAIRLRVGQIPILATLGIEIERFALGQCAIRMGYKKAYDGIYESFHGGLLMTAADTVACFAIMTHTGPEQAMTTTDMNIRFLAPCTQDVRAVATVIKAGKSLCPVHVELFEADSEKLVAVAQVTYMRLSGMPTR